MTTTTSPALTASKTSSAPTTFAVLAAAFAGTVFVSAFLLFQVQPLISKAILPWFGGSPAVWTTCMLFFQLVLFLGYAYAHAMTRFVPSKVQFVVHAALLVLAITLLPVIPSSAWKPADAEQPVLRILVLLAVTVGLPYFILSTTGPIVQAWFARAFPNGSPYRLYALSNIGSLAALLTFPLVFEPALELGSMAWLWSGAFVVFAVLCVYSAYCALRRPTVSDAPAKSIAKPEAAVAPTWGRRAIWVLLPAWASLMLLTVTNVVCQDVAPVPLLWVVPLALYLISFIISFDHSRWYVRAIYAPIMAVLLWAVGGIDTWPGWIGLELSFVQTLVLYFGALFMVCMVCHGELAHLKPAPAYLTEYFLLISLGGALGGLFVSLVAPEIFDTFFEWNLGLAGSFLLACGLTLYVILDAMPAQPPARVAVIVGGVAVSMLGVWQIWTWQAYTSTNVVYRARNFYGMVSVQESYKEDPAFHNFMFVSGGIKHGRQFAEASKRAEPIAYFGEPAGINQAFQFVKKKSHTRVGVVGLGIGTVATFAKPGDYYHMYEINPEVEHIAREYFTFLKDCQGNCDVVLGDARLALEREEPQKFDLLCLDAFSGDSVPTHLLTEEAFAVYLRHMNEDGILCFNITNSYLDLSGVVQALADKYGWQTRRIASPYNGDKLYYRTDYMLVTKNEDFLKSHPNKFPEGVTENSPPQLWTDHYSNIFKILK